MDLTHLTPVGLVVVAVVFGFIVWVARNRRPDYGHKQDGPTKWHED